MLRMVCPKCHHHFPVLGCCLKWNDETNQKEIKEEEEEKKKKKEKEKNEEEKKGKEEKESEEMRKEEGEEEEEEDEEEEEEDDDDDDEDEEEKEKEEEEEKEKKEEKMAASTICSKTATYYVSSLPVSHGTSDSSCFINPSTKIQEPAIFQSRAVNCGSNVEITDSDTLELFYDIQTSMKHNYHPLLTSPIYQSNNQDPFITVTENLNYEMASSEQYVASTCELTGDSVTIATPDIQSGGCLIQHTEPEILVQASQIKIEPKLTGGGCLVQKKLTVEDKRLATSKCTTNFATVNNRTFITSPNGYSELPANIRVISSGTIRDNENNEITNAESRPRKIPNTIKINNCCDCKSTFQQNHCQYHHRRIFDASLADNRDSLLLEPIGSSVQFRVNATVQLPANLGQCTVNITATTTTPPNQVVAMKLPGRGRNNFHGGGLVQPNELDCAMVNQIVAENNKSCNNTEQVDETLTTPVSWPLTAWSPDVHVNRLREVKRMLQICGWYHEGISRQQSENLLKDASIGRWLMRDSSDYRFTFAVSVKTTKGPASIRVHYFLEHFRLETTDPKLALAMPFFDCPIKMLEYYVAYSKRMDEHRREVWVDYSGQLYSQIYLTSPLVKEVRSLSHLARLAVNRNKLPIDCLPLLIKNYIKEYPYTL
ncbi:Suppressor of cytokine signaling 2 [Trachymyrmex septentrionalis]|uniref:Suppressor of cytokine signaling 2 n=2 Tax=Trachymyrmex septentrionalis TaxID=34720 RepID=A0A195FQX5_9HYME|nr:Suppressor of cytokine signaling 2 [Trachymyrmex septentrionalis]